MDEETARHWLDVFGCMTWDGDAIAASRAIRAWSVEVRAEAQAVREESRAVWEVSRDAWGALAATWARSVELIGQLRAVGVVSRELVVEGQARRRDEAWVTEQQQLWALMPGANALTRDLTARLLREAGLGAGPPCACRHCRR